MKVDCQHDRIAEQMKYHLITLIRGRQIDLYEFNKINKNQESHVFKLKTRLIKHM